MAGYTRQRDSNISNGSVINADDFDAEYNALEAAYNSSTGHKHDGTAGEGSPIEKVGPAQDLVVSSSQVIPKTTNTLDLGSAAVQFKNAWFDGTVDTDTLAVSGNTTMGGTLDVTSTITGNVTGNITGDVTGGLTGDVTGSVTGNLTGDVTGDVTSTGTSTFSTVDVNGGNIDNTAIGANTASTVTGTTITAFTEFVGNITGAVTGNADTATAWETARSLTLTGDVTGDVSGIDGSGDIIVTTTVEPNSVALGTDTTGDYVSSLVAGTGVTVGAAGEGATPTISIGQVVGTTSDVTFRDLTASRNIAASGDLTVSGNLTVSGTTTTVNTETLLIEDNIITLNSSVTGTPTQSGGIEIERGTSPNVSFLWDETADKWTTGGETLVASLEGNATTATALETSRNISLTGDVSGSVDFNGGSDVIITATVADDSHNHVISNIDGLQAEIDTKAELAGSGSQAFSASTLNATTVDLGEWTVTQSGTDLKFAYNGTNRMKLDSSGNLTVEGNVTAYGSA